MLMLGFGMAGLGGHKAFFFLECNCAAEIVDVVTLLLTPERGYLGPECCQGGFGECPEGGGRPEEPLAP